MIHIDIKKLGRFNKTGHRITGDRKGQSNSRGNADNLFDHLVGAHEQRRRHGQT